MSRDRRDHPDMRDDAPGRIPESLIDAAFDGELDPETSRRIGRALRYDPVRHREMRETRDAINALRMPIDTPDFSERVLQRTHRHRRFIPARLQQQVRVGRVGVCAATLTLMLGVAGLQRMYPRLTTIAAQHTPVRDIELAVKQDREQLVDSVQGEVGAIRASIAPVAGLFERVERPGARDERFGLQVRVASDAGPRPEDPDTIRTPPATPGAPNAYAVYSFVRQHKLAVSPASRRVRMVGLLTGEPVASNEHARAARDAARENKSARSQDPLDLP